MSDTPKVPTDADGWPNPAAAAPPNPADDTKLRVADLGSDVLSPLGSQGSPLQKAFANLNMKPRTGPGDVDDDDDSLAAEASSSTSSVQIDPKILRSYNWSPPLPWSTFLRLRRSWGQIKLTPQQEENVFKALEKLPQGKIHEALPFVSAFIDKHCPELRHKNLAVPRPGATFLLLSVITGHVELCSKCLTLGANPNSCKFLTDTEAPDNQMKHGYSPMFLACICEQLEIMNLLRQHRGSIHIVDRWGRTPLHAAAAMGSTEVVRWLLKEGAPRKVVDVDLQMPGELCVGKVIPQLEHPSLLFTQRPVSQDDAPQPLVCTCCRGRSEVREMGRCGCVDDMFTRWYSDRLRTSWSTTFAAVRDMQSKLPQQTAAAAGDAPQTRSGSGPGTPTPAA